jgi:CheY-like chemotaxis protein
MSGASQTPVRRLHERALQLLMTTKSGANVAPARLGGEAKGRQESAPVTGVRVVGECLKLTPVSGLECVGALRRDGFSVRTESAGVIELVRHGPAIGVPLAARLDPVVLAVILQKAGIAPSRFVELLDAGAPAPEETAFADRRRRVLVVDDEPLLAAALVRMLSGDYDVDSTIDPKEALARLASGQRYDAILCDVCMPVVSGVDFHEEVARDEPMQASRIVFVTGGVTDARLAERLAALPNAVLGKPLERRVLERAVRAACEARRA